MNNWLAHLLQRLCHSLVAEKCIKNAYKLFDLSISSNATKIYTYSLSYVYSAATDTETYEC